MTDLGNEGRGQRSAGGGHAASATNASEEFGGSVGGEGRARSAIDEVHQQDVEAVDDLGATLAEVVTVFAQQPKRLSLIVPLMWPTGAGQGGDGHRVGIGLVRLAAMPRAQLADPTGQLGRDVDDLNGVVGQTAGQRLAQTPDPLDGPTGFWPRLAEPTQLAVAAAAGRHPISPRMR